MIKKQSAFFKIAYYHATAFIKFTIKFPMSNWQQRHRKRTGWRADWTHYTEVSNRESLLVDCIPTLPGISAAICTNPLVTSAPLLESSEFPQGNHCSNKGGRLSGPCSGLGKCSVPGRHGGGGRGGSVSLTPDDLSREAFHRAYLTQAACSAGRSAHAC